MAEDSGFCLGEDGLLLNQNPVNLRSDLGKKRAACDHPGCLESPGFLSKGCQYQQALPCPQTPGLLTMLHTQCAGQRLLPRDPQPLPGEQLAQGN